MFTQAQLKERRQNYVRKDVYSGESTLVVLPCNNGGPIGNYFHYSGSLWRQVDHYIREWRDDTVLMAVDNAVAWMPGRNDGLGAVEFEWEMSRCVSPDDYGIPTADRFDRQRIDQFVESLRVACRRIKMYGFSRVFVIATPLAYRTSWMLAVEQEGLCYMIFSAARCGMANVAAQMLRCMLLCSFAQPSLCVLFTHECLAKVPLPKAKDRWKLDHEPVDRLLERDLTGHINKLVGKKGSYYVLSSDDFTSMTDEQISARYLVPRGEDFGIFRQS